MRQQTAIVCALLVAAVSIIGAASYTQATVDRNANINVESDSAALVGLTVGNGIGTADDSVKAVNGNLVLNLDDGTGVNGNATFHYGADTNRDRSNTAFNVTNNDDSSRTFKLSYAQSTASDGTNPNVQFDVYSYDSAATTPWSQVGTVTEESGTVSPTLAAGEDLYVFVTVDTDTGNLGSADDLSGTFTVTAS